MLQTTITQTEDVICSQSMNEYIAREKCFIMIRKEKDITERTKIQVIENEQEGFVSWR